MGTAVIVLILAVIGVIAVRSYSKKLTSGCCGADGDSEKKCALRIKISIIIRMRSKSMSRACIAKIAASTWKICLIPRTECGQA